MSPRKQRLRFSTRCVENLREGLIELIKVIEICLLLHARLINDIAILYHLSFDISTA